MKHARLIVGGVIIVANIFSAVFAPWLSPHDPYKMEISAQLTPPCYMASGRPIYFLVPKYAVLDGSRACDRHYLGRDLNGRDILSRLIYGARVSLLVGILAVLFSAIIGTTVGVFSGYLGGAVDMLAMRIVDIVMAFPGILLAITIAAVLGPSASNVIIALTATGWVGFTRIVRAETLSIKSREYVVAAKAIGATLPRVLIVHILPNTMAPLIVTATFGLAGAIITESSLSFLGLGVPIGTPSWGNMLDEGTQVLFEAPFVSIFPGIAIMLIVLALNFVGDSMRDYWDPKTHR